jgi:ribonuclease T2
LDLPQIRSELDYFNITLNLRDSYDFGPVLSQLSIVPSDTLLYDTNKIRFAIKNILKVEPLLVCYVLKDSEVQYFSQMQVCLSKDFQLVDCSFQAVEFANIVVDNEPQETQCQDSMPIHYPTIHYAQVLSAFKNSRD